MHGQQRGATQQQEPTYLTGQAPNYHIMPSQILAIGESPKQKNATNRPLQKKLEDDSAQLDNSPSKLKMKGHQRVIGQLLQENYGKQNMSSAGDEVDEYSDPEDLGIDSSGGNEKRGDEFAGANAGCVESSESDYTVGHNIMMMLMDNNYQHERANNINVRQLGFNGIQQLSSSGKHQDIFYSAKSQLSKPVIDQDQFHQFQSSHSGSGTERLFSATVPFSPPQNICININEVHINQPKPQKAQQQRQSTTSMQRQPPHMIATNPQGQTRSISIKNAQGKKKAVNVTIQSIASPNLGKSKKTAKVSSTQDNLRKTSEATRKHGHSAIAGRSQAFQDKHSLHGLKSPKAPPQTKTSPINRKKVASTRKKSAGGQEPNQIVRNSFTLMNDEEEKVPNEHPMKRSSIGIGTYQTNYFSQNSETLNLQDQLALRLGISPDLLSGGVHTERSREINNRKIFELSKIDKREEGGGSLESLVAGNLSAKKRQPTMMPFNLPGDDLEQLDKAEDRNKNPMLQSPVILDQGLFNFPQGGLNRLSEVDGGINLNSDVIHSDNFRAYELEALYPSSMMRPQVPGGTNLENPHRISTQQASVKDPKEMNQGQLIEEVEALRRELTLKDQKLRKFANDGLRLRRENQQLGLKLQFEIKNNSMLVKNLNRMRHNYFQSINQSPQNGATGQIVPQDQQRSTKKGTAMNQNLNFGSVAVSNQIRPQNPSQIIDARRSPVQLNDVPRQIQKRGQRDLEEEKMLPPTANLESNLSEPSEISSGADVNAAHVSSQLGNFGMEKIQSEAQMIHSAHQRISSKRDNMVLSGAPHQEGQIQRATGLQVGRSRPSARRNNIQMIRQNQVRRQNPQIPAVEEEASLLETQQNDETVLINKVNEMQIKTSRFDQPFLHFQGQLGNQNFFRSEDFIPNEEPLINMREFWGADSLSHNYRMRLPMYQQALFNQQLRMRVQSGAFTDLYHRAGRYPAAAIFQMQMRNISLREGATGNNQANPIQIPQRRTFGMNYGANQANHRANNNQNMHEVGGMRLRVASHGPPLRNINGDSHSFMEEDIQDQTFMIMAAQPNHNAGSLNGSNLILSATGNLGAIPQNQHRASHIQHQYHSDDSIIDFDEEEKHQALPMRNHQMFLQFNNRGGFANYRPMIGAPVITSNQMNSLHPGGGFSFDDGGMDEYDVADERVHLWEFINPDNMTYEEILALQDRIGYVSKGLTRDQINSFPKMRRKEVQEYLLTFAKGKCQQAKSQEGSQTPPAGKYNLSHLEEEKKELDPQEMEDISIRDLSEIEIKNPISIMEEIKSNKKVKKTQPHSKRQVMGLKPFKTFGQPIGNSLADDEVCDEEIDGDEGIISRRLPLNSYNHQPQVDGRKKPEPNKKPQQLRLPRRHQDPIGGLIDLPPGCIGIKSSNLEEEEGCENCREEDEERKEGEDFDQPITRLVLGKEKDPHLFDVDSSQEDFVSPNDIVPQVTPKLPEPVAALEPALVNQSNMQSENSSLGQQHDRCAVCFDSMKKNDYVKVLTCGHFYHIECIDQWLLVEKRCPMCMMYLDNRNPEGDKTKK